MLAIIGSSRNATNAALVRSWRERGLGVELLGGDRALGSVRAGDRVLGRLDVLPGLDGVEPGLLALWLLERRGARVLNPARALLRAHDKLRTVRLLAEAGLPHPRTAHLRSAGDPLPLELPVVVKPRFGSWGTDVFRCRTQREVRDCLAAVEERPWFRRHGAIVQELLPGRRDLRVVVAGGAAVGAIERTAGPGEWRTNIALGGSRRRVSPPGPAVELAARAAAAIGADLVGVDLLPDGSGGHTIVELNGAVDFDETYSLGPPIYDAVAAALDLS